MDKDRNISNVPGSRGRLRLLWLLLILICLFFGIQILTAKSGGKPFNRLGRIPLDTAVVLTIPTYDGSGQAVHPDIMMLNHPLWKEYHFAMTFTPYPSGNDKLENPSLLLSKDGIKWSVPREGMNPLAPAPPKGHNDDPDIIYNPQTKEYYMYYLQTSLPDSQSIIRLTSKDLKTWTSQTAIQYIFAQKDVFLVSPSVIRKSASEWYMFYVNVTNYNRIEFLHSRDGISWDKKEFKQPVFTNIPSFTPWHIDVFKGKEYYYMPVCGFENNSELYLARSKDLFNWEYLSKPLISPGTTLSNSTRIYRSTGLQDKNNLYIWFSYMAPETKWGIAMQRFDLRKLEFHSRQQ